MPESGFLIFWFFFYFFWNFLAWVECQLNSGVKLFSLFLGLSYPVLAKNNAGKGFFNFYNFFAIFSEFSCPGKVWTEFGTEFLFHFIGLSHPVLAKNNAGKGFFHFLNFFAIFFWIFLLGSCMNGIRDKIFLLVFSASLSPFWIEIMPELSFLIFWISLLFFSEFSCVGQVWTKFGTKIFLTLSRAISSCFG